MLRTAAFPRLVPVVEDPSILSWSEHEEGDQQDGPSLASANAAREKGRANAHTAPARGHHLRQDDFLFEENEG